MNAYDKANKIIAEAGTSWDRNEYEMLAAFMLMRVGGHPYRRRKAMVQILATALEKLEAQRELNEPRLIFDIGNRLVSLGNWFNEVRRDT
jgi:hypothetical protein